MRTSRFTASAVILACLAAMAATSANAGVFIGVGPVAVGVGSSRPYYAYSRWHGYGPSMPYGVPVAPPPSWGGYYGYPGPYSSYYAPAGYGYAIPSAGYAPLPYAAYAYPAPAYAYPVSPYDAGPYRKMEIEYDNGGYEIEMKR